MGNLIKTEWYKLRKDRIFLVLLLLIATVAVVFSLEKIGSDIIFGENEYYIGYGLSVNIEIIMRTVPCILAGFFISSEYSMGTMKSLVSSGNGRVSIYFAKLMMFSVGAIIISVLFPLVITGVSAVVVNSSVLPTGAYFLQTIGLLVLYALGLASIMTFFATIFTDSGKTIGFLIFFIVFFPALMERIVEKVSFLAPLLDWSIFNLILNIYGIGQLPDDETFRLVAAPIVTFVIFAILGCIVFKKKEIK